MKFKKGQGALEYLMTYGWAVLIVSVMVILVWQWGFLQPKIEPAAYGFWGVKPLDWQLKSGGVFTAVLTNEVGGNVTLNGGTIRMGGQTYTFNCIGTLQSGGRVTCTSALPNANQGMQYFLEISIIYYYDDTGMQHISSGKIYDYYE